MSNVDAQCLRIKKFANHIPTLVLMEKDCNSNSISIIRRMELFYEDANLREKLISWVKYLYASGQRIRDWDINWDINLEVEDAVFERMPDATMKERLYVQHCINRSRSLNEVGAYEEMKKAKGWD